MNYIVTVLLTFAISACSVQVKEMTPEPTVQIQDLADGETDADGVINARDECPDSVSGALVINSGCGFDRVENKRATLRVVFRPNSYVVEYRYLSEIKRLAGFMKINPDANLTIEGHTSKRGTRALNQILSQNRAQAIKNILVNRFAIARTRINPIGYGPDRPVAQGNSEPAHARNRRIVAEVSGGQLSAHMKWTIYSVDEDTE
jgi:OOP family OmpA-OmpF porin